MLHRHIIHQRTLIICVCAVVLGVKLASVAGPLSDAQSPQAAAAPVPVMPLTTLRMPPWQRTLTTLALCPIVSMQKDLQTKVYKRLRLNPDFIAN